MNNQLKATLATLMLLPASLYSAGAPQIDCKARGMEIKVTFYSPTEVRVLKSPQGVNAADNASLVVVKQPEAVNVSLSDDGVFKNAKSDSLTVSVNTATGAVTFSKHDGAELLTDYSTSFTPTRFGGNSTFRIRQSFMLDGSEPVYGVGQVMDGRFNRRNSSHHMQNENMFTYSPYFMSPTKGYAVYSDNYSISDYTDNEQLLELSQLGDASDYYFIYGGTPDGIIAGIRDLTGHAPMLPLWAYGFFQSKERYSTQQESLDVLKKYRALGVPIDCIIQDWRYWPEYNGTDSLWNAHRFDEERFPDPDRKSVV